MRGCEHEIQTKKSLNFINVKQTIALPRNEHCLRVQKVKRSSSGGQVPEEKFAISKRTHGQCSTVPHDPGTDSGPALSHVNNKLSYNAHKTRFVSDHLTDLPLKLLQIKLYDNF